MQRKKVLVIVASIVLGIGLGGGAWWMWQKPSKSATPSAVPSGSKSLTPEEQAQEESRKEVLAALSTIKQKLETYDAATQASVVFPDLREGIGPGNLLLNPGEVMVFLPDTLLVNEVYAIVDSKIGDKTFTVRLIWADNTWYVFSAVPKE